MWIKVCNIYSDSIVYGHKRLVDESMKRSALTMAFDIRVDRKNRGRSIPYNILCHTAKQSATQTFSSVGSHDNKVNLFIFHHLDNHFSRISGYHSSLEIRVSAKVLTTDFVHHLLSRFHEFFRQAGDRILR